MTRTALAVAAFTLSASLHLSAADKPNYTGSWKMNAEKSDMGPMPKPDKWEVKVDHAEPTLKTTTTMAGQMGERTSEATYKTDGSESVNTQGGNEVKSVAKWEENVLLVTTKREMQGMSIEQKQKWILSVDGKVLTLDTQLSSPQGDLNIKLVLDKQ